AAKLNFKVAGSKLGKYVKDAQVYLSNLDSDSIKSFIDSKSLTFELNGDSVTLVSEDVEIIKNENEGYAVESENSISVALDTNLTNELINEGFAREIVNKVQNMRKTSGFEVTDRITISICSSDKLVSAAEKFNKFIQDETLADKLNISGAKPVNSTEWDINGEKAEISVTKV
ncbi:MAG: isoleucine--tRNA ligase, partial [Calditrichaeota bacterium]